VIDALTGILKRGFRRSRALTRLADSVQFEFEHPPDGPVMLVHSMIGTRAEAVHEALLERFPRANVYATRSLNPEALREWHGRIDRAFRESVSAAIPPRFVAGRALAGRLRGRPRSPWKVITLVRDPVARTIDGFFHDFRTNHPSLPEAFEADPANVDRLIELFLEADEHERGVTIEWFEREIRDVFGIDVLEQPFPLEAGHAFYRGEKCSLLVVRSEDIGRVGAPAIGLFVDAPGLHVRDENGSDTRPCAAALAAFVERLRVPDVYLDVLYGTRIARHFYTAAEIAAFRERWRRH
jgi:hypothetical protein